MLFRSAVSSAAAVVRLASGEIRDGVDFANEPLGDWSLLSEPIEELVSLTLTDPAGDYFQYVAGQDGVLTAELFDSDAAADLETISKAV